MDQNREQTLPENAEMLMAIQHTGISTVTVPESPLWVFYGTYSGIARYRLTNEGQKQFASLAQEFPEVVQAHLDRAQQALNETIAAQRRATEMSKH